MARIAGTDLPRDKRVEIGLTYIFGVGRSTSRKVLADLEIDLDTKVRDLTDADLPSCGWAGSPKHVRELVHQIRRAEAGEVDYLAVCTPVGKVSS